MNNVLKQHDLDRADGRLAALRSAAPLVASIRDNALVSGYARELAGLLGMDIEEVRMEVLHAAKRSGRRRANGGSPAAARPVPELDAERLPGMQVQLPDPHDRLLATERQTAKLLIQNPDLFPDAWDGLTSADFTHPAYAAVFGAVEKAGAELGGAGLRANTEWVHRVSEACEAEEIRSLVASLAVEALPVHGEVTVRYVIANSAALQLLSVMRTIAALKSKLQRTNPVEAQHKYNQMFSELVVLEARRKALHTRSIGAED
jgi:DNA primase